MTTAYRMSIQDRKNREDRVGSHIMHALTGDNSPKTIDGASVKNVRFKPTKLGTQMVIDLADGTEVHVMVTAYQPK